MVDVGASICYSRLHQHVRCLGNYGLRCLSLSLEICLAVRMAPDLHIACRCLFVVSISLLRCCYFRLQRISSRLVNVPKVQHHLLVVHFCCHRHVHPRISKPYPLQRSKAFLWETSWSKESRSANANARNREHPIVALPKRSRVYLSAMLQQIFILTF